MQKLLYLLILCTLSTSLIPNKASAVLLFTGFFQPPTFVEMGTFSDDEDDEDNDDYSDVPPQQVHTTPSQPQTQNDQGFRCARTTQNGTQQNITTQQPKEPINS